MRILQVFAPTSIYKYKTETFPPPLLLGYTEQLLKPHEIKSIDANNYSLFKFDNKTVSNEILDQLITDTKEFNPDIVLISSWSYGIPFVKRYIEQVNATTVLGGYNALYEPEALQKFTNANYIYSGKNILNIKKILENLQEKIIQPGNTFDPNNLPIADFKSFNFKNKPKNFYLLSSYGCKYNCNFCSECTTNRSIKSMSSKQLNDQIKTLKQNFNPKFLYLWDNNLSMNKKFREEFTKEYDGSIPFFTYSRVELITSDLVKQLKQANCTHIFLGVEHTNEQILNFFNKTNDPKSYVKKFFEAIKTIHNQNIIPVISFIVGSPLETKESLNELLETKHAIKKQFSKTEFEISPLILEIGSNLYKQYKNKKIHMFKSSMLLSDYSGFQPFIDDTDDIQFVPQKYLFENNTIKNIEPMLKEFLKNFKEQP